MHSSTFFKKILLLTWKNHTAQWSNPLELILMIILPAVVCLIAVALRIQIDEPNAADEVFSNIDLEEHWSKLNAILLERQGVAKSHNISYNEFVPQSVIGYAPKKYPQLAKLAETAIGQLKPMDFRSFADCETLRVAVMSDYLFAGVCFDAGGYEDNEVDYFAEQSANLSPNQLPVHLNYSLVFPSMLRIYDHELIGNTWMTNFYENHRQSMVHRLNQPNAGGYVGYVREGFIRIQAAVSESYLQMLPNYDGNLPKCSLRRFTLKNFVKDPLVDFMNRGIVFVIMYGFLLPVQLLVMHIVQEKQADFRTFLHNMGIGNIANFCGWFLKAIVYMIASAVLVVIVLKLHWQSGFGLYTSTPWYLLLVILLAYVLATTTFSLMWATFFTNTEYVVRIITAIWVFSNMFFLVWWNDPTHSKIIRYLVCLCPNSLLAMTLVEVFKSELVRNDEWKSKTYSLNYSDNHFNVDECLCIFLLMAFIYCVIGVYMEIWNAIDFRGAKRIIAANRETDYSAEYNYQEPGTSIPPTQSTPSQASQLQQLQRQQIQQQQSQIIQPHQQWVSSTKIFEVEPTYKKYKIKIKKLCKHYEERCVLNEFTMNMYESEVTVLMGHNGSGKTTLLRILAGLADPSRGSAIIEGHNIRVKRRHAAHFVGLALNDKLLLPNLSVANQIHFTCMLKGLSWKDAGVQVKHFLSELQLESKRNVVTKKLSISDRNLLMIACAFAGDSTVILIDDLHVDMDIPTQKMVWHMIQREKDRRSVLMVTSSTEPTEVLSDRVAIIANGELKCTGTKPFLRNMYGHGYRLTCIKGTYCRSDDLVSFLARYMPTIAIESEIGHKITFILESKYEEVFSQLLDALEANMQRLDVVSCTLRETSMEEIFLHMGADEIDSVPPQYSSTTQSSNYTLINDYPSALDTSQMRFVEGRHLLLQHIRVYFKKRWIFGRYRFPGNLCNFIVLFLVTTLTYLTKTLLQPDGDLPPLSFNLTQVNYLDAVVEIHGNDERTHKLYQQYTQILIWYDSNVREVFANDTEDYFLLQANELTRNIHYKYFFGATFSQERITAWFNNIPLHSAPFSLNTVHNALARLYLNEDATIDVTLHPLPYETPNETFPLTPISIHSLLAINLSFCFCFIWPGSAIFLINEANSSFKITQFLSGARICSFWLTSLLYDTCQVAIVCIWIILITVFFLRPIIDYYLLGWIFAASLLSGINVLSASYLFSGIFRNPYYGYIFIVLVNMLGLIVFVALLTLHEENVFNMPDILNILPQYTFSEIIYKLFLIYELKTRCTDPKVRFASVYLDQCKTLPRCCSNYQYWSFNDGIKLEIISLSGTILIYWFLLVVYEYRNVMSLPWLNRTVRKRNHKSEYIDYNMRHNTLIDYEIDPEVISERMRIARIPKKERKFYAVICDAVGKSSRKRHIINRVDLAINRGECFGLLGLSGAGKTTLLKLLIGATPPSYGRIYEFGYNIQQNRKQCLHNIGYCPQSFTLPIEYTPRDVLQICALLHGMNRSSTTRVCERIAHLMGFYSSYTDLIKFCSTGTMRRLSLALALLGNPRLLLIDGAPAGIDPAGKRQIFSIVSRIRQRGNTFIFASLNASECEYMCSRVAIMLSGHFWTLGPMNHLHRRHANGYMLEVRMKRQINTTQYYRRTWSRVYKDRALLPQLKFTQFMESEFPQSLLKESSGDIMVYLIPMASTDLSRIFHVIRRNAFTLNVEDFHITRNTLSAIYTDMFEAQQRHSSTLH